MQCSFQMQSTSSAVAIELVRGALARPYAAVDGTRNSDCYADDGANHHHCDQDADGQPLLLAQAGPSVFYHAAAAGTVLTALLLVCQAVLSQCLVRGPHCAFLSAGADGVFLAEGVLLVMTVGCGVAIFEVLLRCEVDGFDRSGFNAFVGGGRVCVKG